MKIVIDARKLNSSTGRYVRQLLHYLQKLDSLNEYHVLVHTSDDEHWEPKADNFTKHVVPYKHYSFGEQIGLALKIRSLKPDLVHFWMPQQPLLYFGKRVTTVHDLTLVNFQNLDKNRFIYSIEQSIFKFLLKNVSRRSNRIIVPSNNTKRELADFARINAKKIILTYEAAESFNLGRKRPAAVDELKDKKCIFYVGNAFPYKNLRKTIDAFVQFKEIHPDYHLVLAGKKDVFYRELEKYVSERHITDVHFLGFISDAELAWCYKQATAYIFPSLSEGFGLPGLEAMQYKLPVLASDYSCLPEVYGEAAFYFDPLSVDSIAHAMETVIDDPKLQKKLVALGQKQLKRYSWKQMAQETHRVYLSVGSRKA